MGSVRAARGWLQGGSGSLPTWLLLSAPCPVIVDLGSQVHTLRPCKARHLWAPPVFRCWTAADLGGCILRAIPRASGHGRGLGRQQGLCPLSLIQIRRRDFSVLMNFSVHMKLSGIKVKDRSSKCLLQGDEGLASASFKPKME